MIFLETFIFRCNKVLPGIIKIFFRPVLIICMHSVIIFAFRVIKIVILKRSHLGVNEIAGYGGAIYIFLENIPAQ